MKSIFICSAVPTIKNAYVSASFLCTCWQHCFIAQVSWHIKGCFVRLMIDLYPSFVNEEIWVTAFRCWFVIRWFRLTLTVIQKLSLFYTRIKKKSRNTGLPMECWDSSPCWWREGKSIALGFARRKTGQLNPALLIVLFSLYCFKIILLVL